MPAGQLDDGYAERFDGLDLAGLYREGLGLSLVEEFKAAVQQSHLFDCVFVDSRTGFSEESGICTRDLADQLFIVSGLNTQNIQGTGRFLAALRATGRETPDPEIVLSPIPNGEDALVDARIERAEAVFADGWGRPVATDLQIPYHPRLALTEEPHVFRRQRGYLFDAYRRIEQRVLTRLGDTWEAWSQRAYDALPDKDPAFAIRALEMAAQLAEGPGWADRIVSKLATDLERVVGDPLGERVLDLAQGGASEGGRNFLADRLWSFVHLIYWKKAPRVDAALRRMVALRPGDARIHAAYGQRLAAENDPRAATHWQRALALEPDAPDVLRLLASHRWIRRGDFKAAEALYRRGLDLYPDDKGLLRSYARFQWLVHRDIPAALALLDKSPEDPGTQLIRARILSAPEPASAEALFSAIFSRSKVWSKHARPHCAAFLMGQGRVDVALALVEESIDERRDEVLSNDTLRLWMLMLACGGEAQRRDALGTLRGALQRMPARLYGNDFTPVIAQARKMGHPEADWLEPLADVITGKADASTLDAWPAWQAAAAEPDPTPEET